MDHVVSSDDLLYINQEDIIAPYTTAAKHEQPMISHNNKHKRRARSKSCSTTPIMPQSIESDSVDDGNNKIDVTKSTTSKDADETTSIYNLSLIHISEPTRPY